MNGLAAGDIARHSTAADGTQGNGDSGGACVSGDGRYIAFQSAATNLVSGDVNTFQDIFLKDTQTGAVTLVSTSTVGAQGDGASSHCDISPDGRYVAFESDATNLVATDTNAASDIFVKDTQTGATTLVSADSAGVQGNGASHFPSISNDGQYVAFYSAATNLVTGDDNGLADVFVRDTNLNTTTRVSTKTDLTQAAAGDSIDPSISGDGSLVAFASDANNLVPDDLNNYTDIFVKNTLTNTITRVSKSSADAAEGNGKSYSPSISDGRYVAFVTEASNLLPSDANGGVADVVVKDTQTKTVSLAAADNSGTQIGSESRLPSISADGRRVAFETVSGNLYSGDADDGSLDIFTKDMLTGAVYFMPINSGGDKGNANSEAAAISGDGSKVAFASLATNLVSGDTNTFSDVFSASPLVTDAAAAQTTTTLTTITQMTTTQMTTTGRGTTTAAPTSKTTSLPKTGGDLLTIAGMVIVLMLGGGVTVYLANRRTNRS